jgi:hypothetical protein
LKSTFIMGKLENTCSIQQIFIEDLQYARHCCSTCNTSVNKTDQALCLPGVSILISMATICSICFFRIFSCTHMPTHTQLYFYPVVHSFTPTVITKIKKTVTSIIKDVKLEPSYIADGNVKWCGHFAK